MELKEKNNLWLFLWRFNQGIYDTKPNGLCSLFWGGLLGGLLFILSAPFTLIAWGITKFRGKVYFKGSYYNKGPLGILNTLFTILLFLNWIFGYFVLHEKFGVNETISAIFGIFFPTVILLIILSVGIFISEIYDKSKEIKNQNISILTKSVYSIWNKVCPRIEWKK